MPLDAEQPDQIRAAIRRLCEARGVAKSACPSEVAREVFPADWRSHMDEVRAVATELIALGEIEITQAGEPVDPSNARGPIRLRWKRPSP